MINTATKIAVTHIDLFEGNDGDKIRKYDDFTLEARKFLEHLKSIAKGTYPYPELKLVSNGAELEDMVEL
jgi:hypothetical protein